MSETAEHEGDELYDADPQCKHVIVEKMSGISCKKCAGWFCF